MTDLIAFLSARLDEDEATARIAAGGVEGAGDWHVSRQGTLDSSAASGDTSVGCPDGCHPSDTQNAHIARHDPARVLREVEAKRAILERYERAVRAPESVVSFTAGQDDGYRQACLDAMRDFAAVYSDHPDYREEWAS